MERSLYKLDVSTKHGRGFIHLTATSTDAVTTIAMTKGYTVHGIPKRMGPAVIDEPASAISNTSTAVK